MLGHLIGMVRSRAAVLLIACLVDVGLSACGGSHRSNTSSNAATVTSRGIPRPPVDFRKVDQDRDNDGAPVGDDTNNRELLDSGRAASSSDRRGVETLVRRYYAAALAQDGATACSLLYSIYEESVPKDYGVSPPSQPYMVGTTCPAVLIGLFKHLHSQLAVEVPLLKVTHVRLEGRHGLAVLTFGSLPERQIGVKREGRTWKLEALLDSELP